MTSSPAGAVVVGGGIAGLSVAYELHRRGRDVLLLEGRPRLGGVIHTERPEGFTIDAGPDSLLVQKPAALELCREIGLGDRLIETLPPRTAYIVRNGRLHALPAASVLGIPTTIGALAASRLFSTTGKLRMAAELAVGRRASPAGPTAADHDESIGAFVRRRFGEEAVRYLAEPLLAGIHSGDVERLSVHALFPRLVEAERTHGSVIRAFRARAPATGDDGAFRSLAGGVGELVERLATLLPAAAVRTGTPVTAISGQGPFRLDVGSGEPLTASRLVLAVPATVASRLLRDVDPGLADLCGRIPYVSSGTVVLAYPRDAVQHSMRGTGFLVPRAETGRRIIGGSWVTSKWPGRAPRGLILLRAFVGGRRDPAMLEEDDGTIVRRVRTDLDALLGISGEPLLRRVYRWPDANPQYEVGHAALITAIEERLARLPGLSLTGSGYRGVGIPDCVSDGRAVGASID